MSATLSPEVLYARWRAVIEAAPPRWEQQKRSPSVREWLGRVVALSDAAGSPLGSAALRAAISGLASTGAHEVDRSAQAIWSVIYQQLASAELSLPVSSQGGFIVAGSAFEALTAITTVIERATSDLLVIDPYLDGQALTKFVIFTPIGATIRLLADAESVKPTLKPAVEAWKCQYGVARPLEARLSPPRTLHDRTIIIDGNEAYILTQSLNSFASRSHASIARADSDIAALKIPAYEQLWTASTQL